MARIRKENIAIKRKIKCLFINRLNGTTSNYDIGLLTEDYVYFQTSLRFIGKDLTSNFFNKISKIFRSFLFTIDSDVMFSSNISKWEPLLLYIRMLREQIGFNTRQVDLIQIPKRIQQYHQTYIKHRKAEQIKISDIPKLWKKIVELEKCPWINKDVDTVLQNSYSSYRLRHITIRMAVYYMLIKQHLYFLYKNSDTYKKILEKRKNKTLTS